MGLFDLLFPKKEDAQKVTEEDMRNTIIKLNLPITILELFDGTCADKVVTRLGLNESYGFTKPYAIIDLLKYQQDHYLIDRYIPLLAYGHGTIYAYDSLLNGFIKYYLELGPKDGQYPTLTWDGVFIDYIFSLWENKWIDDDNEEYTNEDIIYVGKLLGLKHIEVIMESIVRNFEVGTFNSYEKWTQETTDLLNTHINE